MRRGGKDRVERVKLAPAVGRTNTWLGIYHRRMRARLGPAAANTATAHKLAAVIYHLS